MRPKNWRFPLSYWDLFNLICSVFEHNEETVQIQLIGTPSEEELGFLNENAKRYIRQLPFYRRQSFYEKFPHVHPAAIDLIERMLTFDPRQRIAGKAHEDLGRYFCFDLFILFFFLHDVAWTYSFFFLKLMIITLLGI